MNDRLRSPYPDCGWRSLFLPKFYTAMRSYLLICSLLLGEIFSLSSFLTDSALAGSGGNETGVNPPTEVPAPITTQVNQQNGLLQINGVSSNLTSPNCSSGCAYGAIRVFPGYNGASRSVEGIAGVIWQFNSPESSQAEATKLNAELQKYKTEHDIIEGLSLKLAEAIEQNKIERAYIIAIILAPKLRYEDYRVLLREVSNGKLFRLN